jgi:hypothetical protein
MDLLSVETPAENDLLSSFLSSQSKIAQALYEHNNYFITCQPWVSPTF